ncbi:ABC transporter permease subunit [Solicola gregarius]|uniref:ABC transporter permease n=1 Tax=Solicola gregarius TaxID=2908642 RepID=A0AA46TKP8_9ACTN|nr:ABC transporter permease subunit [Solicola gregarius]UYM07087.1 ABC transporter permease [Solicola gregarius]
MTAIEATRAPVRTQAGNPGLSNALHAEWIKLWSVRSSVWTMVALLGFGAGLTALICATTADGIASGEAGEPAGAFITWGMMIAQVTAVVLGVLAVSNEYGNGMIRTTLTATPRRKRVLLAKSAVLAAVLFVGGTVTAFAGYFAGNPFLDAEGVGLSLGDDGVIRAMFGSGLYLAALGLFSAALAFLVRHTAAAISIALALIFVVGNLVLLVPGQTGDWLMKLMPGNAGSNISTVVNFNPDLLAPWTGFGVFCLETAVLFAFAAMRFVRRDA